jgi:hypothetical protein
MKRYIAAILVPCLLLQLCGCYSQRVITFQDLPYEVYEDITITINDSLNYIVNDNLTTDEIIMHPENNYCVDINVLSDHLILVKESVVKEHGESSAIIIDTLTIKKSIVQSIEKSEIDEIKTTFLVVGIATAVVFIGYLIAMSTFHLDFSNINLSSNYR